MKRIIIINESSRIEKNIFLIFWAYFFLYKLHFIQIFTIDFLHNDEIMFEKTIELHTDVADVKCHSPIARSKSCSPMFKSVDIILMLATTFPFPCKL